MTFLNLCLIAALMSTIIATPITPQQYTPPNALCTSYNIPLSISTKGLEWNFTKWTDNVGLIDYVSLVSTRPDANRTIVPLGGPVDLNGDYTIAAMFCSPKTRAGNGKESNVLLLSHGGGYDSRYWNAAVEPEKYNFVQAAVDEGYSVFLYDRLGWGGSSRLSGFVNQAAIQTAVLTQLTHSLRNGQYTASVGTPEKIIYVGHSYGSAISYSTISDSPSLTDGVVLTGLGFGQTVAAITEAKAQRVAKLQDPKMWADFDEGYIIEADIWAHVNSFFKSPSYTLEAVHYANSIKVPVSVAELASVSAFNRNATAFKGPVLIQNGEFDFLVCGGYCPGINDEPAAFFKGASAFNATIVPKAGHGLALHTTAPESNKAIFDWLDFHGL